MDFWMTLGLIFLSIYLIDRYYLSYWSRRGFIQANPKFLIGNLRDISKKDKTSNECFEELYNKYKKIGVVGFYFFYRKVLLVTDPKIIQDILIRNFQNFHDRPSIGGGKRLIANSLFFLSGRKWRDLRAKLTPLFTSGKLKAMYPTIRDCSRTLEDYLMKSVDSGDNELYFKDLFARYTTSIISSIAFGVENDCINDPENIFRQTGKKIFNVSWMQRLRYLIFIIAPKLISLLPTRKSSDDVDSFFMSLVRQTIEFREKNKDYKRNDFMQLMIQLKNQGFVSVDKNDEEITKEKQTSITKLTVEDIASQSLLFFIGGFDTSSTTLNLCLIELCKNPKVQEKVHEELERVVKDEELTYDIMSELKYLECCIDETLRKYPISSPTLRMCTKDFIIPDSNMVIEAGTQIMIPTVGIHRDPEFFENPLEFKPERFINSSNGSSSGKEGIFYLPFGDGPHNCIGTRLGKLQIKLGLASILSKFKFELVDKSLMDKEIEFDPRNRGFSPKNEVLIRFMPKY